MKTILINWETGMVETYYRGARTVRFFNHMRPESILRLRRDLRKTVEAGYAPTWVAKNAWVYGRGTVAA